MKTTIKIRLFAIAVLMAAIVAGNNFEANAQHRDSRNGKKVEIRGNSSGQKSYVGKRDDHSRNDHSNREIHSYSNVKRYGDAKQNDNYRRRENDHRVYDQDRHAENSYHGEWNKHGKPDYHRHYEVERHASHHDYYHHPKYGKTYRKFYSNPYVFRHNHGRYYYYDGHFCNYRPGIGYVVVDIPYLTIFTELPFHCNRVRIHGNVYYQYGDLYFEAMPIGYRLVPSPVRINISAQF